MQINGSTIPQVNLTKFLGVYIDEHLNWSMHLNKLATKIAQNIGIPYKLKHFLPSYILKMIYCSLVLPHLQYCTLIWANTYTTKLNKIINNSDYLAHSEPLFKQNNLLKIEDIYKLQLGLLMYKHSRQALPNSISTLFQRNIEIHNHNTRIVVCPVTVATDRLMTTAHNLVYHSPSSSLPLAATAGSQVYNRQHTCYTRVCVCMRMCQCMRACVCQCVRACARKCMCKCVCQCVRKYVCRCVHKGVCHYVCQETIDLLTLHSVPSSYVSPPSVVARRGVRCDCR